MNELIWEGHFDAAHKLEPYEGKCKNVHGHTWQVFVRIQYDPATLSLAGLSVDFHQIKAIVDQLDHAYLNDVIEKSASAENILMWLVEEFQQLPFYARIVELRLWESSNASVRWITT